MKHRLVPIIDKVQAHSGWVTCRLACGHAEQRNKASVRYARAVTCRSCAKLTEIEFRMREVIWRSSTAS